VVIGDLDEDGRNDAAIANTDSNTLFVYGNLLSPLPIITEQPTNACVVLGSNVSFTVVAAGGTPLSCQWFFDGTNFLAGATQATLTLMNVRAKEAGCYSVLVTNAYGSALSSNAYATLTSSVASLAPEEPPVAGPVTLQRYAEGGVRASVGQLLRNDTANDGYGLPVVGVSSNSAAGGTVSLNGGYIFYLPPARSTMIDDFTYTISDGQ
jgi:hypothetical protein